MKFTIPATMALLVASVTASKEKTTFAVLRFTNKKLTQGRMDPIIFPGQTSAHVHTVMGGSGFSLNSTGKDLQDSKCSNALIKGDNSNYWFPSLYFHDPKTHEFESVEFYYFNAYYFFEKSHDDIKPFPLGLQMVAGNASSRVMPETGAKPNLDPSKGPVNAARMTCPRRDNNYVPASWSSDSDGTTCGVGDPVNLGEGVGFPDRTCDGLYSPLRADVHFPSCYNPEAGLDNYMENSAYPEDNDGYLDCPEGWIHVPHLFYEAYWHTDKFEGRWEEGKGEQPFVFSNGDVTGYSSHGDFMAGWDEKLLQHIIDTCDTGFNGMDNCPGLFYGLNKGECTIESEIDEKVEGIFSKLPGNNPLQGWSYDRDDTPAPEPVPEPVDSGKGNGGSSKTTARPSATKSAYDDVAAADVSSSTAVAAVEEKTTDAPEEAFQTPEATSASSQAADYSKPAGAVTKSPESTNILGEPGKSTCKSRTHTVWKTVTVTQSDASAPVKTESAEADLPHKRDHVRRHAHNHGHSHNHGHIRRRSHHH